MLVEGPPGPEGPAVSDTLHLAPKDARSSGVRDARGGLGTQPFPRSIASICPACVQSASGLIFLVQK